MIQPIREFSMLQSRPFNKHSLVFLCLFVFISTIVFAAEKPVASQRLEAALADDGFPWRNADGTLTVWVYFQDKGLQGADLDNALQSAENQLNERTAKRRAKMKQNGERLADAGDLPVNPKYLDQAQATGASLRRESRWLNAASFRGTNEQVRELSTLPFVREVDLVARFQRRQVPVTKPVIPSSPEDREKASWSIDYGANLEAMEQAGVPAVHEMGIYGQGVVIGMLDSGFHPTHESLAGTPVLATYDFVNDDENVDNEEGDPFSAKDHGTKTMSTAVGNMPGQLVAPAFGSSVVLAKTEDIADEVPIEEDHWVAGLEWVESLGVDIVSSSLGYFDWYDFSDLDGNTAVTTIAGDLAVGRGLVVVCSAGNERATAWGHIIAPSDGDSVITVGAVDLAGNFTGFSSPGPTADGRIKPDVAALGSSNTVANPDNDTGYETASGTSFSCPLTSGVAALILSRSPGLTPLQVREALRETASMADNPNNDFGWGIINAYEAVRYFTPQLMHTPLRDTEITGTPLMVAAVVTDRIGLDFVTLNYRLDGASWQQLVMTATGEPDTYSTAIPGQNEGVVVDYYLSATGTGGVQTHLPAFAPEDFFTFRIGPDLTAPSISHTPLLNQALIVWPPTINCVATDNLGIDRVELEYQLNGRSTIGPYVFDSDGTGNFSLDFPMPVGALQVGDILSYNITAYDSAETPNSTNSGWHYFSVIEAKGVVLVLEDGTAVPDLKYGPDKSLIKTTIVGDSSAGTIANWLAVDGFVADVMPISEATLADFQDYQAVVVSSGDNRTPLIEPQWRQTLQDFANSGGKILIEGGEIGYDSLSNPGYPEFAAEVLHALRWNGDTAGDLQVVSGQENHPLLNVPFSIPDIVDVTYTHFGDEDAVTPRGEAFLVMETRSFTSNGGILVYDDNQAPQSAQVVYFSFNIETLEAKVGQDLILNSIKYLLASEGEPTASLSGTITLAEQSDHSGILVTSSGGPGTTTAVDGSWSLQNYYGGIYDLTFSKVGWGTMTMHISLEDGQQMTNLDLILAPVVQSDYSVFPGLAIPDNSPTGILSPLVVPEDESGVISGVTVDIDISHTWIGDLTVKLYNPDYEPVVLHNASGDGTDDLLGNWPETLDVDGPGNLNDYIGTNNAGTWYLYVSDDASPDAGILNSWGLHFLIPGVVASAEDGSLPRITRLNPNVPNPFNPTTKISFDLAKGGPVKLGIYDLRGMMVRLLVSETLAAGSHTMGWNGLDDGGRSVSSGVYLYRLESPGGIQERKMVLVR
jgi:subtilisin family serine protease/subtilisin-like proprotein convertase family protein